MQTLFKITSIEPLEYENVQKEKGQSKHKKKPRFTKTWQKSEF